MFLRATEMNDTNMSLGGFFDVNRTLFKSVRKIISWTFVRYINIQLLYCLAACYNGNLFGSSAAVPNQFTRRIFTRNAFFYNIINVRYNENNFKNLKPKWTVFIVELSVFMCNASKLDVFGQIEKSNVGVDKKSILVIYLAIEKFDNFIFIMNTPI